MKTAHRLDGALRFWQSRYDTLAMEVDHLVVRHRALQGNRDQARREAAQKHERVICGNATAGNSLHSLHTHLVAHGRYDQRNATQQQALNVQIEEKRSQMQVLKQKLKQVESIRTNAERAHASSMQRRLDEEASYLFLIRNRPE